MGSSKSSMIKLYKLFIVNHYFTKASISVTILKTNLKSMYDFSPLKQAISDTKEHYKNELSTIRTGRAAPALLDAIRVDSYGTKVPLNQVASVTTEDARTLRVSPWELDSVNQIEQAIRDADLGVSLSSDEKGVRVCFPELTSERRTQLIKLTHTKLEEARISLRRAREDTWTDIQKKQKNAEMSEDDKFRSKEQMEKLVKEGNDSLEELAEKKEQELNI
jgi:ribosome recycling factor